LQVVIDLKLGRTDVKPDNGTDGSGSLEKNREGELVATGCRKLFTGALQLAQSKPISLKAQLNACLCTAWWSISTPSASRMSEMASAASAARPAYSLCTAVALVCRWSADADWSLLLQRAMPVLLCCFEVLHVQLGVAMT